MTRKWLLVLWALLVGSTSVQAEIRSGPVGLVKVNCGEAAILRDGRRMAAQPGIQLVRGDVLSTGAKVSMGVRGTYLAARIVP